MRNCLAHGLISLTEVVSWADKSIGQLSKPGIVLIEISMASNLHINDVINLLRDIPGKVDLQQVYQGIFSKMKAKMVEEPESEKRIVQALFEMAMEGEVPDKEAESEMFWFYDALDLAEAEYTGDIGDVRRKLYAFLDNYSTNLVWENDD